MSLDRWSVGATVLYALVLFVLLPPTVVARWDDFAYLESTIATYAAGRPVTSDWLDPNNALFEGLTACVFAVTGNFYLSTIGVLYLFGVANAFLVQCVARQWAQCGPREAAVVALVLLTNPIYLNKALEFTAVVPAFTFFLLALSAFAAQRRALFVITTALAFGVRESALVLAVLPLHEAITTRDRRRALPIPLLAVAFLAFASSVDVTYAQTHTRASWLQNWRLERSAGTLVTCVLIAQACFAWSRFLCAPGVEAGTWRTRALRSLGVIALLALALQLRGAALIGHEAPSFLLGPWWLLCFVGSCVLLSGLQPVAVDVRHPLFAVGAAYVALLSLRGLMWDYYFIEVGLLAFLLARRTVSRPPSAGVRLALVLALVCLGVQACYAYQLRCHNDRIEARTRAYEGLLRAGALPVTSASDMPTGYAAWKLFDHLVAHEGKTFAGLSSFLHYVRRDQAAVEFGSPVDVRPGDVTLAEGSARIGLFEERYRVVLRAAPATESLHPDRVLWPVDPAALREKRFPLTNDEWRAYIADVR